MSEIMKELLCKSEQNVKCEKCHKDFSFTFGDDVYYNLMNGQLMVECPHCGAEHKLKITINMELDEPEKVERKLVPMPVNQKAKEEYEKRFEDELKGER